MTFKHKMMLVHSNVLLITRHHYLVMDARNFLALAVNPTKKTDQNQCHISSFCGQLLRYHYQKASTISQIAVVLVMSVQ